MDLQGFKDFLINNGVGKIDGGKTQLKCYSEIPPSSLVAQANRLNSSWIRAQYIIVKEPRSIEERDSDLNNWKNLSWAIEDCQFLLINVKTDSYNEWEWYNKRGDLIGNFAKLAESIGFLSKTESAPRQIIWYGAPGTGKSFTVNKETNKRNSVRTTFHPDTDYASFVGTYKPTLQPVKPIYHNIQGREEEISYKFVPQVFLKAYVAAWKKYAENPEAPEPYYLVIEEINRGNCAQIFGDLFQLLDREDDGTSSYEIVPDTDIEKFLRDDEHGFADVAVTEEFSADIKNGRILKLPSNLFIYATMNTSDQSLFPIDSAFKRRWEWRYTPIEQPAAKNWTISANGKTWSWWKFLERINFEIGKATYSEDKKLGYFFARAKKTDPADIDNNNGVIEASTFVSKVLFYLWNDVIKDNDFNRDLLIDKNGKTLDFTRFFKTVDGKTVPNEELVEQFIENVMKVELPDEDKKVEETTKLPADETIEDEDNN